MVICYIHINKEVQDSIQIKRMAKNKLDFQGDEESRQKYRRSRCVAKREVATAKERAYSEIYKKLETREEQKDFY